MGNDAKRQKRRERERQRDRRRAADSRPFDNAKGQYRDALLRLYRRAPDEYPRLVRVVELLPQARMHEQEALDRHGMGKRYKAVFFKIAIADGYQDFTPAYDGDTSVGGWTQIVEDRDGCRGAVVFMKRDPKKAVCDAANISLFLHELGHVDDFANGVNWIIEKPVDMEALELYAHEFACRKMIDGNFLIPLCFYIDLGIEQLARASVTSIAQAAQRFKSLPLYKECQDRLGPILGSFRQAESESKQEI